MRLRGAEPDDVEALARYINSSDVFEDRMFGRRIPFPLTHGEIAKQVGDDSETHRMLVVEADDEVVGHASIDWWWDVLQPWFGVVIDPAHRRQGYGRKAATMILGYLFETTPAHVVTADAGEWNTAGQALATALGFSEAGRYRNQVQRDGEWQDIVTFDLLRREWEASRAS